MTHDTRKGETMKTIEGDHPKPWRLIHTVSGVTCLVDANNPSDRVVSRSVVIGRLRYATDGDKALAHYICRKLNAEK